MTMKLVAGLGNPGEKYKNTRHNVGFMFLDKLVGDQDWEESKKILLVKPMKFMNKSGEEVAKRKNFYKIDLDDVYVVHDDLDLKLGEFKIQKGVGPKVHNGVSSVENHLGSKEFWRVRVGIDNRDGDRKISGEDYVLGRFRKQEMEILVEVLGKAIKEVKEVLCI
jgi:peptidyl-tRNA hydrolase, PTH1 family